MLTKLGYGILSIIIALLSIFSPALNFRRRPADAIMRMVAVSDTHIGSMALRVAGGSLCFNDIAKTIDPDLLLIDGDCVDEANEENWTAFETIYDKYCGVENVLMTLGNHDTWEDYDTSHDYDAAVARWLDYTNRIMNYRHDSPRYAYEQNGFHFVVLAQETTSTAAEISDAQIAWADGQITAAEEADPGRPVFVLLHQPMAYTHGIGAGDIDDTDESFTTAQASRKLMEMLDSHENIIYISGHAHHIISNGQLGYKTVEKVGEHITSVNLPSMLYGGQGAVIDVYEDRVEFMGRNFLTRTWDNTFRFTVEF